MKRTKKVFRSCLSVLLIVFLLTIFLPVCIGLFKNKVYDGFFCVSGMGLFVIFVCFRGAYYIISDNMLYIKWWFIPTNDVDITHLESVEHSYDPTSTCAYSLSLKRLHLQYKRLSSSTSLLISPVREEEFISEMKAINPDIKVNVPIRKGIWRFWD